MEKLIEILGTQGVLGLAFVIGIALVYLTRYLYKREEKKSDTKDIDVAIVQNIAAALTAIQIHFEQGQKDNERHDKTLQELTRAIMTMTGIVENSSIERQNLVNSINKMNEYLAVLKAMSGGNKK